MRWEGRRQSTNIEDRRGRSMGRTIGIGGGIGTLVLVLVVMFLGGDPTTILNAPPTPAPAPSSGTGADYQESSQEAELRQFAAFVLADTEDTWDKIFSEIGGTYQHPTLVLFTDVVQSACGTTPSAAGPFYCPLDRKVYLDLSFYQELSQRFGASGDFAYAYVVAHEIGHHVQTLLGISDKTIELRQQLPEAQANALSVRQELQADCFAGIWGHEANRSRQLLEAGDVEEALNAAAAIGDDRIQRQSRRWVNPESFTHGTSEQRVRWFKRGFETGRLDACDTFGTDQI